MKYDLVKYAVGFTEPMPTFIYLGIHSSYETEEQAKEELTKLIEEGDDEYEDDLIPYYAISDLPSLKDNNGVITMTFYASATLDNVTKGKLADFAKNHRMDCHFI